ncbi:AAA family ATPase [Candidatus Saccharibacteria bacterium]|nr:AAA family ATPase [Candidatus Saccharibacteria bacterium]
MKSLSLTTPHVIFVVGKPGVGKTQFATRFSDTFSAPFLEVDKLRDVLGEPTYSHDEQDVVDRLTLLQLNELLKSKQTFLYEGGTEARIDRQNLAKFVRSKGYESIFVWVQTDDDTAFTRSTRSTRSNKDKTLIIPEERYDYLVKRFTPPASQDEQPVVISGKHTYASQVRTVLKRLAEPNRPAVQPLKVPKRQVLKGNSIKIS